MGAQSITSYSAWELLVLFQHELLLFAGIIFLLGALDEFAVDIVWLWLKLTGRASPPALQTSDPVHGPLAGEAAIFIPAWREDAVIGDTVRHMLEAWPQTGLTLYVGCYANDPKTAEAVIRSAGGDTRLRLVLHDCAGPSTKADCLNRLYRAMVDDEIRSGITRRMVVLHDAEDMVDPAALHLLDDALADASFAQLPVRPVPQRAAPWIGSHYCEEFAEAHAKNMVVRDALKVGLPAAGVGCAVRREILDVLAHERGADGPFAADCLTEDYELGLNVARLGETARFVRRHAADGRLVATQAYFPSHLAASVRQKTRWVHGIAFEGWDRMGWSGGIAERWMRLRDRRGPLNALVLAVAYLLLVLGAMTWALGQVGLGVPMTITPALSSLIILNFAAFLWRAAWRFGFTAREYGLEEGIRAVLRIPVSNIIAIMAGRRALMAYIRSLRGDGLVWDKTGHDLHPVRHGAVNLLTAGRS